MTMVTTASYDLSTLLSGINTHAHHWPGQSSQGTSDSPSPLFL